MIVFDDADLPSVVAGIKAFGYYNAGQDCTAACRIYAGKKIYDNLVADLSSAAKELKFNLPNDDENEIGPLISKSQKGRVQSFVERAGAQKHISITAGGNIAGRQGFFFEPTVVAGAHAGRRDRAQRGVRPGGVGHPLRRRRPGRGLGQ